MNWWHSNINQTNLCVRVGRAIELISSWLSSNEFPSDFIFHVYRERRHSLICNRKRKHNNLYNLLTLHLRLYSLCSSRLILFSDVVSKSCSGLQAHWRHSNRSINLAKQRVWSIRVIPSGYVQIHRHICVLIDNLCCLFGSTLIFTGRMSLR